MKYYKKLQFIQPLLLLLLANSILASEATKSNFELIELCKKDKLTKEERKKAKNLIKQEGVNINLKKNNKTALSYALENQYYEIAISLINAEADLEKDDKDDESSGETTLHYACRYNRTEMVKALFKRNINIDERNNNGNTPLHLACENKSPEIAQLLIDKNAKIDLKNNNGNTPLHLACENNSPEIAQLLIDKNAKIDLKNNSGNTALHIACKNNSPTVTQLLIDNHAKIDLKNNDGNTALHLACEGNQKKIVKLLLIKIKKDNKRIINLKNRDEETALYSVRTNPKMVEILLDAGANPDIKCGCNNKETTLDWAKKYGNDEIKKLLKIKDDNKDDHSSNNNKSYLVAISILIFIPVLLVLYSWLYVKIKGKKLKKKKRSVN